MKIIISNPPNFDRLNKIFKIENNTIFTYGDAIYNPHNVLIDTPLMKHEEIHSKQQGDKPDDWWDRYLVDPNFRLSQEIPAYQIQYRELKKLYKDRNVIARLAHQLAGDLSSGLYGDVISQPEAYLAITSKKNYEFKT